MRLVFPALALVFCAAAQSIPESETVRARHLLDSPAWRDKAWGVYVAGRLNSEEYRDRLVDAFREASGLQDAPSFSEEHAYLAALFDAAIQSGIRVPAEILEPFVAGWRAPVIVLLAGDSDNEESLLRMSGENLQDVEWLAIDNLLLERRSQRFFTKILSQVEISHLFTLTDPGDTTGRGGGTGGMVCGDGGLAMPKGFPPIGVYYLVNSPLRGDVLAASGPQSVYYRRFVVPTDHPTGVGVCVAAVDRRKARLAYLDGLAIVPAGQEAERVFSGETRIEYRNEANLRQQWDSALAAQEGAIRAFVARAQEHGMPAVSGMTLTIVPKLDDRRKITAGPVPPLTPREFVLE